MWIYWVIALSILVFFLLLFFLLLVYCARLVAYPHLYGMQETYEIEKQKNLVFDYEKDSKEEVAIPSFDGYLLHGTYVPNAVPSKKYVIITHGNTYTRYGSLKYLDLFYKEGYNVLIYDDRGHGANAKNVCTMGLKEGRDLLAIIHYMYQRFGADIILGLHGESMGAAISLMVLEHHPKLAFAVVDCPYAELDDVLKHQLKIHYHLPGWLVPLSGKVCHLCYGYDFCKVKPIEAIKDNEVPLCFMHGDSDTFIDKSHSVRLSKATAGYSEVHFFEGAEHAKSFQLHPEEYRLTVHEFLKKIGV
jgi:alpha-beta hydrolase superfamily lysophospholipase